MVRLVLAALLLVVCTVQADADDLALKRVMLSSGGIGYFEYSATVDGDAALGLDVPLDQVDDILKSLVVFDAAGGVAGVELPGRDNTVQAFGDAPFGPEALDSPAAYLTALRGTEVTVQGTRPMTGRIVSAESMSETTDKATTQRTRVTLLTAEGMRQFVLEDADAVQITNPDLRARIEHALEALRRDASNSTRHLTVYLKGKGKRQVSIGYVAGAPLWKATYRLMLGAPDAATARLQGWATLENQSGADWKGVTLTLQYGNPVTFRQALYRSYFVQRPEVPVEILGHVLPGVDEAAETETTEAKSAPEPAAPAAIMRHAMRGVAMAAPAPAPPPVLAAPAETAASNETAEETIFTLAQPVDLAAGHTANVPIIDRDYPAPRIGLVPYQQPHPLASVRIRNDDTRALPAGVLTVYDADAGSSFAGDARLGGLPVGETRLLSFAQDLRTNVDTKVSGQPNVITSFSVADGVLTYTVRYRQVIRVSVTAPAKEARDLLLEIPRTGDETLTMEDGKTKVTEQTANAYRIALSLAAGQSRVVTAWLDRPIVQGVALVNGDYTVLRTIAGDDTLDAAGRAALAHILDQRRDEARKQSDLAGLRKQLSDAQDDEDRIRKNLTAVSAGDALRSRLTKALDADETKIDDLRKSIADAQTAADQSHRALADAVGALHI
jgi:hypothetical protein